MREPTLTGIVPTIEVSNMPSVIRKGNPLNEFGIGPVSWFCPMNKDLKFTMLPKLVGIGPTKEFVDRSMYFRSVSCDIARGIVPEKRLL